MATPWLPTSDELGVVLLSLRVAVVAIALMLVPGVACAWLLARRDFPGKAILDTVVHLPLVLPPVVVGYLLLVFLGRRGVIGEPLGLDIAFTWKAAAIAAAAMGFPLLVRSVRLAIEAVDTRLEQAAGTLGAGPWRIFATVTLPLALPGLLTGTLLAFARCLGEFGATITFAGNIPGLTRTLPTAIYTATQSPGGDAAAARLAAISIILAVLAVGGSEILARRLRRTLGNGGVLTIEATLRRGPFSLDVAIASPAATLGLFGQSGAGKTTLLHVIAGVARPQTGRVRVGDLVLTDTRRGVFVPPHRRGAGVVFQEDRLLPHRSVRGNLEFGRRTRHPIAFDEVVDRLELAPLLNKRPRDLSGGERRRVAIGRAALAASTLLLLDEPLTGLDTRLAERAMALVHRLRDVASIAIVAVAHDRAALRELVGPAGEIAVIEQGRVVNGGAAATVA